jgi:hypothetical protein
MLPGAKLIIITLRSTTRPQLLAAIQLVRSWVKAGFKLPDEKAESELTVEKIARTYNVGE